VVAAREVFLVGVRGPHLHLLPARGFFGLREQRWARPPGTVARFDVKEESPRMGRRCAHRIAEMLSIRALSSALPLFCRLMGARSDTLRRDREDSGLPGYG
jgi:hypothetical protein